MLKWFLSACNYSMCSAEKKIKNDLFPLSPVKKPQPLCDMTDKITLNVLTRIRVFIDEKKALPH